MRIKKIRYRTDAQVKGMRGAPRCQGYKRDGTRCKGVAIAGTSYCRFHGGRMIQHNTKSGLYRKYQPEHIRKKVDELLNNPELMNMREHVALMGALLSDVWETISKRIKEDQRLATTAAEREAAQHLTDDEIQTVMQLADRTTAAIERAAKVGLALKAMVSLDTVDRVLEVVVDIASKFLRTEKQREKFLEELKSRSAFVIEQSATKYSDLTKEQ